MSHNNFYPSETYVSNKKIFYMDLVQVKGFHGSDSDDKIKINTKRRRFITVSADSTFAITRS